MTPIEARSALNALVKEIGPRAYFTCFLNRSGDDVIGVVIEPTGRYSDGAGIRASGSDYSSAVAAARAAWVEREAELAASLVRRMALSIIELAAEGAVTDRRLMNRSFNAGEIAKHGDEACAEATRLAGNMPFSILKSVAAPALRIA